MKDPAQRRLWRLACLALVYLFLLQPSDIAAIARAPGEHSAYLEDALVLINKEDYEGAVIQLKNALKRNPDHLPARILLGKTYLRLGHGAAAESELRRALRMGADEGVVLVPLGNALLLQRKYEEVLETIRSGNPASIGGPKILSIRGQAYYELGKLDEAERSFDDAASLGPSLPEPLLGKAGVLIASGRLADAESLIVQASKLAPENPEVWFRLGELRQTTEDLNGALAAYDRALEKRPTHMRARLARATVFLETGDYTHARADAEFVKAASPDNPKAAFLLAQALVRLGETELAEEAFQQAVDRISLLDQKALFEDPAALQLAALISFAKQDLEQANRYLQQYLTLRPHSAAVRRLLGRVQLQLGDSEAAIHTLYPVYLLSPDDTELLTLLGDAYLREGRYIEASDAFEKAIELMSDQPELRLQLAISRLGAGQTKDAVNELQRVVDLDAGTLRAGILLTLLQLKTGDYEAAAGTALKLRGNDPENPAVHNLIGTVKLKSGDFAAARQDFEKALQIEPHFSPARYNLARLELHAGDFKAASRQYRAILEEHPREATALIGLADIALSEGRIADATELLGKASIDPDDIEPQIRLIDLYLQLGEVHDALRRAIRLSELHPETADVLVTLARAQIATGNRDDAILNYRRAVRFSRYVGNDLLKIAMGQVKLKDFKGARWTLQKAVETGMSDQANAALVRLDLLTGNVEAAMARASDIRTNAPESSLGDLLVAEVSMHMKRYAEAMDAYKTGMEKGKSSALVLGLYKAQRAMGDEDGALALLEEWTAANPDDLESRRTLALGYVASGRLDAARARHEALLEANPDDPVLLANLARIYQLQNETLAREYAEKAVAVAPEWAISLDTLGWILVTEGEAERGLAYLREAISRNSSALIRYHLASALSELGRLEEARNELRIILDQEKQLEWIQDVRDLYEKLSAS